MASVVHDLLVPRALAIGLGDEASAQAMRQQPFEPQTCAARRRRICCTASGWSATGSTSPHRVTLRNTGLNQLWMAAKLARWSATEVH